MNNTEKLLRAFIESQGCEIEEVITHNEYTNTIKGAWPFDDIEQKCVEEIIDYKVTENTASKVGDMVTICGILEKHNMSCMDFVLEVQGSKNENL